ncbi:MAG: beta-N-acetylhexosaminidase [Zetaproteobacteria bacterium]|nr:MAG: beta-N-acetylhexosaminidase [Zetaproteobacteria bacterium]
MHGRVILGLAGTALSKEERRWLRARPPAGIILFARNADTPGQLRRLIGEAQEAAGRELIVAVDEEGGRVNRLPWPPFCTRPAAATFGAAFLDNAQRALQQARDDARRCAAALRRLGISHNCAPVLDLRIPGAHDVIGARAYSDDPEVTGRLGAAVVEGMAEEGIGAVGKHFPGHGRARCDSHQTTPEVVASDATLQAEMAPFAAAIAHGLRHVMTAHVRYPRQDRAIATFSRYWLGRLREELRFSGTVWSDDLGMGGTGVDLPCALQTAAEAGCDLLLVCRPEDCRGVMEDGGAGNPPPQRRAEAEPLRPDRP